MSSWPNRPPAAPRGEGAPAAPAGAAAPDTAVTAEPSRAPDRRARSRGQSLVEFALVLPILFVLLLIAIDFGRVYLGYINVQNMARIAANEAATNPTAWANNDSQVIATYRAQILQDARMINCALPLSGGSLTAAVDPTFSGSDVGDTATVRIACSFSVITPIIADIVGGTVTVAGEATFPVRTGMIANGGSTGGGINAPTADFYADKTTIHEGEAVQFHYSGGGGTPTNLLWEFGDGKTSTEENPLHTYTTSGAYDVSVTASNTAGTDEMTKTSYVIVLPSSSVAFSATPLAGTAPLAVVFKDESVNAVKWSWTFGDGTTSTEQNPSKTYTKAGTFDVTLVVEDDQGKTFTLAKSGYVTAGTGLCTVPDFFLKSTDQAPGIWASAGFTTPVQYQGGNKPWPIKSQTIVGYSQVPCSSTITVKKN